MRETHTSAHACRPPPQSCTSAFCEDDLPEEAEILGDCQYFLSLGQPRPNSACFIKCSTDCGDRTAAAKRPNGGSGTGATPGHNGPPKRKGPPPSSGKEAGCAAPASKRKVAETKCEPVPKKAALEARISLSA